MNQNTKQRVSALERSKGGSIASSIVVDPEALREARELLDAAKPSDLPPVVWSNQNKTSGFVRVSAGDDKDPFKFTGLLLPYEFQLPSRDGSGKMITRLRNRILIVGKKSHEWFLPFCGEIFNDGENMRLRVRVDTLHQDRLAFIIPAARTPNHAKAEWTVALATYKARYPQRYSEYSL